MQLAQKVALMTSDTSGIGEATVRLFVSQGARVAFTGRREELDFRISAETGARFIPTDHRLLPDSQYSVEETLRAFGGWGKYSSIVLIRNHAKSISIF